MIDYADFLKTKERKDKSLGFDVSAAAINPALYPFQNHLVRWALKRGRAALFEDCGLGKTPQQLEWARIVAAETSKPVMIFAPLAVAEQTAREGTKFGIPTHVCREQGDVLPGVNITNYQKIHHFDSREFGGVVLDESSILKNYGGFYRKELTQFVNGIRFRLCATATPAPNDLVEIINHAEFLSIASGKEMIALYFIQDGNTTHAWRLRGHAVKPFYRFMAQWCAALRSPADLGYDDKHFMLPALSIEQHVVDGKITDGFLFPIEAQSLQDRRQARKESVGTRVGMTADMVNGNREQWLVWCNLNYESDELAKAIPDAIEVRGGDTDEHKTDAMMGFAEGRYRVLVSKPSICGYGMNFQSCANMAFVGLSDSWEQFYQAVRRCWRFGQTRPVTAHVIISEKEGAVVANIERKETQAQSMMGQIIEAMNEGESHALVG